MDTSANGNALLQLCVNQIDDWANQQFSAFLQQVGENFLQASLATRDETNQTLIFHDYKRIEKEQPLLLKRFASARWMDETRIAADATTTPAAREYHELLASLQESVGEKAEALQQYLHPEHFIQRCRLVLRDAGFEPQSEAIALGAFHEYFVCTLPSLYKQLQQQLPQLISDARGKASIQDWISHIEDQLDDPDLGSGKRSLARARLRDLRRQMAAKPGEPQPAPLRDRWSAPYPEAGAKEALTDSYLRKQVEDLLRSLKPRDQLPASITQLLQHLHPAINKAALQDRTLFCLPLHPARQLVDSLAVILELWHKADADQQQRINYLLRQVIKRVASDYCGDSAVFRQLCHKIEPATRQIIQSVREHQQQQTAEMEDRNRKLQPLRDEVDTLLNDKLGEKAWPPTLEALLMGPVRDLLMELHLQYGAGSDRVQRGLRMVDDLLWYVQPHSDWQAQKKASIIGEQLERELLNGFRLINFDLEKGRELIGNIHRLQLLGSRPSPVQGYSPSRRSPAKN